MNNLILNFQNFCLKIFLFIFGTKPLFFVIILKKKLPIKLRGFSPQANYTDRATAACRRS
jgi:hypothetical protein